MNLDALSNNLTSVFTKHQLQSKDWFLFTSGGADSTVSLLVLMQTAKVLSPPPSITLVCVDHSIPYPESVQEDRKSILREHLLLLKKNGFEEAQLICYKRNVPRIARMMKTSFERAGSLVRRRLACRLASPNGIVFWGHNLNDWYETLVLKINRGASPQALAPFPFVTNEYGINEVRPLALTDRASIRKLAEENNLPWWEDPENDSKKIRRVVLRSALPIWNLDGIRQSALLFLSEREARENRILKILSQLQMVLPDREFVYPLEKYLLLPEVDREILLGRAMRKLGLGVLNTSHRRIFLNKLFFRYGPFVAEIEKQGNINFIVFRKGRSVCLPPTTIQGPTKRFNDLTKKDVIMLHYGHKSVRKLINEQKLSIRQKNSILFEFEHSHSHRVLRIWGSYCGWKDISEVSQSERRAKNERRIE